MSTKATTEQVPEVMAAHIAHVAATVDSHPEGNDAAILAAALVHAVGGDLILASIEPELPLVIPGADWRRMREETKAMLNRTRDTYAPDARLAIASDLSIARGLRRVLRDHHRELVVCGSGHRGREGQVSIGHTTRQLVEDERWALAIAPRGLSAKGELAITRIGVGFDSGPESRAALAVAMTIAGGCGARLLVRGVIDDRIPALGWPNVWIEPFRESWNEVMDEKVQSLRDEITELTAGLSVPVGIEIDRDIPSASLLELSLATDLLVIGSRRWGPVARLLLGGTGEALTHGAHCSLLIVPRPDTDN